MPRLGCGLRETRLEQEIVTGDIRGIIATARSKYGKDEIRVYGAHLLDVALKHEKYAAADQLLKLGADINQLSPRSWRLLYIYSYSQDCMVKQFDWVVSHGYVIDRKAPYSELDLCAVAGCPEIAKRLLKLGEDPLRPGPGGRTPLDVARTAKNLEVAKVFEEALRDRVQPVHSIGRDT